jgi:hypothetical protein
MCNAHVALYHFHPYSCSSADTSGPIKAVMSKQPFAAGLQKSSARLGLVREAQLLL